MLSCSAAVAFYGWPLISANTSYKDETSVRVCVWVCVCACVCVRVCVSECVLRCACLHNGFGTIIDRCFPHSLAPHNKGWSATNTIVWLIHHQITLTPCPKLFKLLHQIFTWYPTLRALYHVNIVPFLLWNRVLMSFVFSSASVIRLLCVPVSTIFI